MFNFPLVNQHSETLEIYGRRAKDVIEKLKHLWLNAGKAGLFNLESLEHKELILCSSVMDALSFWIHGYQNVEDMKFAPVTLGIAEYLDENSSNSERIDQLMAGAFEEAIGALANGLPDDRPLRVYLGIPKARPGLDTELESILGAKLELLAMKSSLKMHWTFIREDHDSGLIALSKATEDLNNGHYPFVLIGGVDSFVDEKTVAWLETENLLKCSTNTNGFTPGEAASFCLLCHEQVASQCGFSIMAKVVGTATTEEPHLEGSELPTSGQGLSSAIRTVLAYLPEDRLVEETFCTLKGLRHEAEEFSFTIPQTGHNLKKPGEFTTLVHHWGDIGAASAPALLCYAVEKRSLEFSEAGYNLVFTQSPGSSRSAALIQTF